MDEENVYRKGRIDALNDLAKMMYNECFVVDHESDDLQKWDSGNWFRYKLFENVCFKYLKEIQK